LSMWVHRTGRAWPVWTKRLGAKSGAPATSGVQVMPHPFLQWCTESGGYLYLREESPVLPPAGLGVR